MYEARAILVVAQAAPAIPSSAGPIGQNRAPLLAPSNGVLAGNAKAPARKAREYGEARLTCQRECLWRNERGAGGASDDHSRR
jgi:hypothetical protein